MVREQRLVFGEDAELYDRSRAGYPDLLVAEVMAFGGLSGEDRAVEVGAGTGKATVAFARTGMTIVAIEPSLEMASIARRNCAEFGGVSVEVGSFEEWNGDFGSYGLIFAAQSWHWIDPSVRYRKAAQVLRPGGTLALMWHRTDWSGEKLHDELDEVYGRIDPELKARKPGFPGLKRDRSDSALIEEISATGVFGKAAERRFPRKDSFTADEFVNLLSTQSDHRLLRADRRERLFAAVRDLIATHGGTVEVPHETWLVMARRVGAS